ncbi:hypothetical protein, partial [Pseudomonas marginalis]|uniref:hypothetical protein n=1 Tax=Pseudomonas marginalis TaxID=298 RepID=UPI002B1E5398
MGAIARETTRGWMTFAILWGLNVAYSLSALFYQIATFSQHPESSALIIGIVILVNLIIFMLLRRSRSRVTLRFKNPSARSNE